MSEELKIHKAPEVSMIFAAVNDFVCFFSIIPVYDLFEHHAYARTYTNGYLFEQWKPVIVCLEVF